MLTEVSRNAYRLDKEADLRFFVYLQNDFISSVIKDVSKYSSSIFFVKETLYDLLHDREFNERCHLKMFFENAQALDDFSAKWESDHLSQIEEGECAIFNRSIRINRVEIELAIVGENFQGLEKESIGVNLAKPSELTLLPYKFSSKSFIAEEVYHRACQGKVGVLGKLSVSSALSLIWDLCHGWDGNEIDLEKVILQLEGTVDDPFDRAFDQFINNEVRPSERALFFLNLKSLISRYNQNSSALYSVDYVNHFVDEASVVLEYLQNGASYCPDLFALKFGPYGNRLFLTRSLPALLGSMIGSGIDFYPLLNLWLKQAQGEEWFLRFKVLQEFIATMPWEHPQKEVLHGFILEQKYWLDWNECLCLGPLGVLQMVLRGETGAAQINYLLNSSWVEFSLFDACQLFKILSMHEGSYPIHQKLWAKLSEASREDLLNCLQDETDIQVQAICNERLFQIHQDPSLAKLPLKKDQFDRFASLMHQTIGNQISVNELLFDLRQMIPEEAEIYFIGGAVQEIVFGRLKHDIDIGIYLNGVPFDFNAFRDSLSAKYGEERSSYPHKTISFQNVDIKILEPGKRAHLFYADSLAIHFAKEPKLTLIPGCQVGGKDLSGVMDLNIGKKLDFDQQDVDHYTLRLCQKWGQGWAAEIDFRRAIDKLIEEEINSEQFERTLAFFLLRHVPEFDQKPIFLLNLSTLLGRFEAFDLKKVVDKFAKSFDFDYFKLVFVITTLTDTDGYQFDEELKCLKGKNASLFLEKGLKEELERCINSRKFQNAISRWLKESPKHRGRILIRLLAHPLLGSFHDLKKKINNVLGSRLQTAEVGRICKIIDELKLNPKAWGDLYVDFRKFVVENRKHFNLANVSTVFDRLNQLPSSPEMRPLAFGIHELMKAEMGVQGPFCETFNQAINRKEDPFFKVALSLQKKVTGSGDVLDRLWSYYGIALIEAAIGGNEISFGKWINQFSQDVVEQNFNALCIQSSLKMLFDYWKISAENHTFEEWSQILIKLADLLKSNVLIFSKIPISLEYLDDLRKQFVFLVHRIGCSAKHNEMKEIESKIAKSMFKLLVFCVQKEIDAQNYTLALNFIENACTYSKYGVVLKDFVALTEMIRRNLDKFPEPMQDALIVYCTGWS